MTKIFSLKHSSNFNHTSYCKLHHADYIDYCRLWRDWGKYSCSWDKASAITFTQLRSVDLPRRGSHGGRGWCRVAPSIVSPADGLGPLNTADWVVFVHILLGHGWRRVISYIDGLHYCVNIQDKRQDLQQKLTKISKNRLLPDFSFAIANTCMYVESYAKHFLNMVRNNFICLIICILIDWLNKIW